MSVKIRGNARTIHVLRAVEKEVAGEIQADNEEVKSRENVGELAAESGRFLEPTARNQVL